VTWKTLMWVVIVTTWLVSFTILTWWTFPIADGENVGLNIAFIVGAWLTGAAGLYVIGEGSPWR
jgi:hypothetical protein